MVLGYGSLSKLIGTRPAARSSLRQSKTQVPPGSADKRIPEMPDWLSAASQISSSAAVLLFWPPTVKSLQPSDLSLTDQTAQSRKGDIWLEKQYKTWFAGHEFTPQPKKICMFWWKGIDAQACFSAMGLRGPWTRHLNPGDLSVLVCQMSLWFLPCQFFRVVWGSNEKECERISLK